MIEIKNSDVKDVLLTIAGYTKEGKLVQGLLIENVSLGLKRKLQKIHAECSKVYLELEVHLKEVNAIEDEEKKKQELKTLMDEVVKLQAEKASLAMIENITTEAIYDFDIIEMIAE